MPTRCKIAYGIHLLLPVLVLCGLITSCAPGLVSPTDPNSSLVMGRIVIDNKHPGRYSGILPLGTVDQGIEVEVESHDGNQYFKVTTEKQGYFFIPNMPPNTYYVSRSTFEGTDGRNRESYSMGLRRLNFTPVPGKITYIGTLFIELSERAKRKIREARDNEKARAYFSESHGDSAWASRKFTTTGRGQVPTTQVAKRADQFYKRGYRLMTLGQYEEAICLFQESLKIKPTAEAYTYLGWTYGLMREYERAIEEAEKAIRMDPDFGNPYNDIGVYLMELGRENEAIPYLENAMRAKRYCCYHFPHYNMGRIYLKKKMYEKAREEFKKSLAFDPGYVPPRVALEHAF